MIGSSNYQNYTETGGGRIINRWLMRNKPKKLEAKDFFREYKCSNFKYWRNVVTLAICRSESLFLHLSQMPMANLNHPRICYCLVGPWGQLHGPWSWQSSQLIDQFCVGFKWPLDVYTKFSSVNLHWIL